MARILVCGFGSIGAKHAAHLKTLDATTRIWCRRPEKDGAVREAGYIFEPSLDNGLSWADAVVVATATDGHMSIARQAAQARRAIYLEKPVSHNRDGLENLRSETNGLVVEVGCQMRRHLALMRLRDTLTQGKDGPVLAFQAWVGQRLDQWRPGTDYRSGYSADTARGGGALFDLVHEIDLLHWLVGPMATVAADLRHNSDLDMTAEDLANILLVARNGAAGVVQLDMLSPAYRRGLQIVCRNAVWSWDFTTGELVRDGGKGRETIVRQPVSNKDLLADLMRHFLKRLENPSLPPCCSLAEGIHDLDILLAARQSSASGMRQSIQ